MKLSFSLSSLLLTATLLLSPLEVLASSRPQALQTTEASTLNPNQQSDSELSRRLQNTKPWSKPTTSFIDSNEAVGSSPTYISQATMSIHQIVDINSRDPLYGSLVNAVETMGMNLVGSDGKFRGNSYVSRAEVISMIGQALAYAYGVIYSVCPNYQFSNLGNYPSILSRATSFQRQIPIGELNSAFRRQSISLDYMDDIDFLESYAAISVITGGTPQLANPPSKIGEPVTKGEITQTLFRNLLRPLEVVVDQPVEEYGYLYADVAGLYEDVSRSDRFYHDLNVIHNYWLFGIFSADTSSLFWDAEYSTNGGKFLPDSLVTRYQMAG